MLHVQSKVVVKREVMVASPRLFYNLITAIYAIIETISLLTLTLSVIIVILMIMSMLIIIIVILIIIIIIIIGVQGFGSKEVMVACVQHTVRALFTTK